MSGSPFSVTFFGEAKKVTALRHEQLVERGRLHSTKPLTLTLSRKGRGGLKCASWGITRWIPGCAENDGFGWRVLAACGSLPQ